MFKPELLAPAGDAEKLLFAYLYGADAAYIGAGDYSLRLHAGFSLEQIAGAISLARQMDKKLYLALNSFMRDSDLEALPAYLQQLAELKPDAFIVSDPGVFTLVQKYAPQVAVHISTQANNTNWLTARFWQQQGASRIILARELSLAEAAAIGPKSGLETEIFIHGAMCISYSGRCLLSSFMTGRSANQGNCSHPCRYNYALMEEKRPGEFFPIEEDGHGSYIMNSRDLCLIDYIPQLCDGSFASLKIEGRNKSAYYVANAVRVYRAAIDAYAADPQHYSCDPRWRQELAKISHREYTEAFAQGAAGAESMRYDDGGYIRGYDFAAILHEISGNRLLLEQRNHIAAGDQLEALCPDGSNLPLLAEQLADEYGAPLAAARHPRQLFTIANPGFDNLQLPLIVRRPVK